MFSCMYNSQVFFFCAESRVDIFTHTSEVVVRHLVQNLDAQYNLYSVHTCINPSRETKFSGVNGAREELIFPVQHCTTTSFLFCLCILAGVPAWRLISIQYDGRLLPDIILLTQCYYH